MNKHIYTGPLKDHLQNYVDLKRAMGHKFDMDASNLKRFDSFILEKYPEETGLTKEIALEWCRKKSCETEATRYRRASLIRKFGIYLDSIGVKAYILPKKYYPVPKQYTPYIYTVVELEKFFSTVDQDKSPCRDACPYRQQIMPVIFRMIYTCGLRSSEAKLLKVADVDHEHGTLTINQSKNDNSRLVPMSDSLTERELCLREIRILLNQGRFIASDLVVYETSEYMTKSVYRRAMSMMDKGIEGFNGANDSLNKSSFVEHDLVLKLHEAVFHIFSDFCDQSQPSSKELFKQGF